MRSCPASSHLISSTTLVVLLLLRGHLLRRIRVPVLLLRRREAYVSVSHGVKQRPNLILIIP